jgi:mannose-6-phosphate isomerase-like protein (cupin superfamily)
MEIVRSGETIELQNARTCTVFEYPTNDPDANVARIWLNGRYPIRGASVNREVKEVVYVESGEGEVTVEGDTTALAAGDVIVLDKGESMCWEGKMVLIIFCSPAWYPDQYEVRENGRG